MEHLINFIVEVPMVYFIPMLCCTIAFLMDKLGF